MVDLKSDYIAQLYKWCEMASININKPTKISKHPDRILSLRIAAAELIISRDFSTITANARLPRNGISDDTKAIDIQSVIVSLFKLKNPGNIPR